MRGKWIYSIQGILISIPRFSSRPSFQNSFNGWPFCNLYSYQLSPLIEMFLAYSLTTFSCPTVSIEWGRRSRVSLKEGRSMSKTQNQLWAYVKMQKPIRDSGDQLTSSNLDNFFFRDERLSTHVNACSLLCFRKQVERSSDYRCVLPRTCTPLPHFYWWFCIATT